MITSTERKLDEVHVAILHVAVGWILPLTKKKKIHKMEKKPKQLRHNTKKNTKKQKQTKKQNKHNPANRLVGAE